MFHGIATASKAAFGVVVAAHSLADGRDATPVLRARRVPRVGEDEDAPRDGALLSGAEAGDVPAAARLPPGAVLTLERHGVAELRVGTAAAAAEPDGRRGGAGGAGAEVGAGVASLQFPHRPRLCRGRQRRLRRQSRPLRRLPTPRRSPAATAADGPSDPSPASAAAVAPAAAPPAPAAAPPAPAAQRRIRKSLSHWARSIAGLFSAARTGSVSASWIASPHSA